jgi:hypothetical protein
VRIPAALLGLVLSACTLLQPFGSTTTHVDYVDLLKWDGIDYTASFATVGRAIGEADIGPEHFRVKQTLVDAGRGPYYQIQDGDAAFVPTGEPVFTVKGYVPTFRLAARHDGRLVLYEAHSNPAAKAGRDLLDVEGKVFAIALLDQKRGTVLGRIAEPSRVEALVRLVLDGGIGGPAPPAPSAPAVSGGPTLLPARVAATIAFELADGTATVRGYDLKSSTLTPNITVAGTFRDAIAALIASAPTPTPAPALVNLAKRYDLARAQTVVIKRALPPPGPPAGVVAEWASALDAEMPATRSDRAGDGDVMIFSFADRSFVSLVYDRANEMIRVAVPDDELAVRATPALKALLAR